MLGRALAAQFGDRDVVAVDSRQLDVADPRRVREVVADTRPQVVLHCAAMTAVDECESRADDAFRVNALGSAHVAAAAHRVGARLVAFSTDYVFDGELDRPYHEWDTPRPRTVYGQSKLAGEEAVRTHCPDHLIVRTAWLYGPGGPSFVHTMLRLGRDPDRTLQVVDDQHGNPTSTCAVATCVDQLLERDARGTVHVTCRGDATWFELAREVLALTGAPATVRPCTTAEYPRPAPRPANSRLDPRVIRLLGLPEMPTWRDALRDFFVRHPQG